MLVSVVMSIYKPNLRYLAEQLKSIDSQDLDDMEVIVYNDYPEDESREVFCKEHCTRHPLRYVHEEENRGYVKAFEYLVQQATGSFVVFSDQDGIWLPGRIEKCLAPLEEGHLLVSCDRQVIDGEGTVEVESWRAAHPKAIENRWKTGERLLPQAVFTCFSIGMATMMRTGIARELIPYPTCTGHDKWLAMGQTRLAHVRLSMSHSYSIAGMGQMSRARCPPLHARPIGMNGEQSPHTSSHRRLASGFRRSRTYSPLHRRGLTAMSCKYGVSDMSPRWSRILKLLCLSFLSSF